MSSRNPYANVVLGFAEEALPETNHPETLASKAGGLPVWLYRPPARPPPAPRCGVCKQPQKFLLQIYCPLEASEVGHEDAFHRMIYVAICGQSSCQRNGNCASVVRAQLGRDNPYYGWDGGACVEEGEEEVCAVCGFWGERRCGGCGVRYCGRGCQMADWKAGHREICGAGDGEGRGRDTGKKANEEGRRRLRFAEVEIVTDRHPTPSASDLEEEEEAEEEEDSEDGEEEEVGEDCQRDGEEGDPADTKKRDSRGDVRERGGAEGVVAVQGTMQDADADELPEDLFRGARRKDGAFERMRRLMKYAPDQVIRYERGGGVVWGRGERQCADAGMCGRCGGRRVAELQVMPQLVYYICPQQGGLTIERVARRLRDDMDWATIAVFTCERSCGGAGAYVDEAAWVQAGGA